MCLKTYNLYALKLAYFKFNRFLTKLIKSVFLLKI